MNQPLYKQKTYQTQETFVKNNSAHNHSNGSFEDFVQLVREEIFEGAKKHADSSFFTDLSEEAAQKKLFDTIENTYYTLSDDDFVVNERGQLEFGSGIPDKNGSELRLRCIENTNQTAKWFCKNIIFVIKYNNKLSFNPWDLYEDLVSACGDIKEEPKDLPAILNKMKSNSIYTNAQGIIVEKASCRYVNTGFRTPDSQSVYAFFRYKPRGKYEEGWHYEYLIYQNQSLENLPKNKWLQMWAKFDDFSKTLGELKNIALDDFWGSDNRILSSYLNYTFCRLYSNANRSEGKIEKQLCYDSEGKYVAFNTGLPDKYYHEIYALFEKISKASENRSAFISPEYKFIGFIHNTIGRTYSIGQIFKERFEDKNNVPERPVYFNNGEDIYLRPSLTPEIVFNENHILIDRFERLPLPFFNIGWKDEYVSKIYHSDSASDEEKREAIWQLIKNCKEAPNADFISLKNQLYELSRQALCNVRWNWRSAIPYYYPKRDSLSWLIPIRFKGTNALIALVVERIQPDKKEKNKFISLVTKKIQPNKKEKIQPSENETYQINTILTPQMAYNNARLICRPESDWLVPPDDNNR